MKKYNKYGAAHKNEIHFKYQGPQVSNLVVDESCLSFNAGWGSIINKVKITRVNEGWVYEDVGIFTRLVKDVEYLRWDFELPQYFIPLLENLKPTDYQYTEDYHQSFQTLLDSLKK